MTAADGHTIAARVRAGDVTAVEVARRTLEAIAAGDGEINSFTSVLTERAMRDAARVDALVAAGKDPGPLAGVPVAVKNLYDVAGQVTVAGSRINSEHPPAAADADAVARLCHAGTVLVGALNMDEYAYGFTTENSHYGPCHNPHDHARIAGGSSGGSAAAVAARFVPLALGSDTNGSVRVPAALCGVMGLKPTYGLVSRRGMALLCPSLDCVGVLGRSVRDLAAVFDVLRDDKGDAPPAEPETDREAGVDRLRFAVADGYFTRGGEPEVVAVVDHLAKALGVDRRVTIPGADEARSAAMVITAAEGAQQHLADLRRRPGDFDSMTRDRLLAGALLPAPAYLASQRFRRWFRAEVATVLASVDVLLAPATPFPAPLIGQRETVVAGKTVLTGPYLGCYTQPLSFVGLPVVTVPVAGGSLPLGVQLVAAPYREPVLLRVAAELERRGLCVVPEVA